MLLLLALRLAQMALAKPFWHDELFSLGLATASFSEAWSAMTSGFEFNPPLGYLVVRLVELSVGRGELITRTPFLLAGLLSIAFIYRYFSCAGQPWRGVLAACLYVQSGALEYFIDARAYVFVLLGLSSALVGWRRRAVLNETTGFPLALFGAGLFIVTSAHFWSLGILLVFGLAELTRAYTTGRADWKLWLVAGVSICPVLQYPILLGSFSPNIPQYGAYHHTLYGSYIQLTGWSILTALCVGIPVMLHRLLSGRALNMVWPRLGAAEMVLLASLAGLPIIIYLVVWAVNGYYMARYGLWASLAIVFVLAMVLGVITAGSRLYRYYSLGVLSVGCALFTTTLSGRPGYQNEVDWQALNLEALDEDLDIVIGSGMQFISIHYYASEEIKPRIIKVVDPELAWTLLGSEMEDRGLIVGTPYLGLTGNLVETSAFRARQEAFYFVDYPGWLQKTDWFVSAEREVVEGFPLVYRIRFAENLKSPRGWNTGI
jgi:hypothetical protein